MKHLLRTFRKSVALAASGAAFVAIPSAFAQTTVTWNGSTSNSSVSIGSNWVGGVVPTFGSAVQGNFNVTSNATKTNNATIDSDIAFGSNGATTAALNFTTNSVLSAGGGNITIYGTNSGANLGLRTTSGASSVMIEAPIRIFATSPVAGSLGNIFNLTVNNTSAANTALTINGTLSLAAGSSATTFDIRYSNGSGGFANTRIAGPITGLGAIANGNTGTWNSRLMIAGNQSLSTSSIAISSGAGFGATTGNGSIQLGESASETQTWGSVTLNNTMRLAIGGNVTISSIAGTGNGTAGSARVTGAGVSGAKLSISSGTVGGNLVIGGSGAGQNTLDIVKQGAGTLNVFGAHTYNGSTTVNSGTLSLASNATLATSGITVNGGTLANAAALSNSIVINGNGTLSGEGSTASSLTFGNGTSSFLFDPTTGGAFAAGSVTLESGALVLLTPTSSVGVGNSTLVLTNNAGFAGGVIPSGFAAASRGTLSLSNLDKDLNFTATGAASLVWAGNATLSNWDVIVSQNWTNGGSPDRYYDGDSVTFNDVATSANVTVQATGVTPGSIVIDNSSNAYSFTGGSISGTGSLTKNGTGSATIGNTLNNTGGIIVNGGALTLSAANNFGAGGVTVTGGLLNLNAANTYTGNLSISNGTVVATTGALGTISSSRPIQLNSGNLTYTGNTLSSDSLGFAISGNSTIGAFSANATLRAGSPITGTGNVNIEGPGVVAFGRNGAATLGNTFNGTITVKSGGTLDIRNPDSMGATGAGAGTVVESGGALMINPFNQTSVTFNAESITFKNNATLTNRLNGQASNLTTTLTGAIVTEGTMIVNTVSTNTSLTTRLNFDGGISGGGGVDFGSGTSVGGATVAGTYALNAANSYLGATTVTSGTLLITSSGSVTSNVTVSSGAFIGGNGTITGDLSLLSGANFVFSLTDSLKVSGTVSFGGFGISNVLGLDGTVVANGVYTLIGGSASINTANLANLGAANAVDIGGGRSAYFEINSLDVVVVPEPGTWVLLAMGLVVLLGGRALFRKRSS